MWEGPEDCEGHEAVAHPKRSEEAHHRRLERLTLTGLLRILDFLLGVLGDY